MHEFHFSSFDNLLVLACLHYFPTSSFLVPTLFSFPCVLQFTVHIALIVDSLDPAVDHNIHGLYNFCKICTPFPASTHQYPFFYITNPPTDVDGDNDKSNVKEKYHDLFCYHV